MAKDSWLDSIKWMAEGVACVGMRNSTLLEKIHTEKRISEYEMAQINIEMKNEAAKTLYVLIGRQVGKPMPEGADFIMARINGRHKKYKNEPGDWTDFDDFVKQAVAEAA